MSDPAILFSERFGRPVRLTTHARLMMTERDVPEVLVLDLIENGEIKHKTETDVWIFRAYPERRDNMLCVAALLQQAVIIKTVMIRWQLEE